MYRTVWCTGQSRLLCITVSSAPNRNTTPVACEYLCHLQMAFPFSQIEMPTSNVTQRSVHHADTRAYFRDEQLTRSTSGMGKLGYWLSEGILAMKVQRCDMRLSLPYNKVTEDTGCKGKGSQNKKDRRIPHWTSGMRPMVGGRRPVKCRP